MTGSSSFGVCALCDTPAQLCISHSIPNHFYRLIFRRGKGNAIRIADDEKPIRKEQKSGGVRLLCESCERRLNLVLDSRGIEGVKLLRRSGRFGDVFPQIDQGRMKSFYASVFWRASLSDKVQNGPSRFSSSALQAIKKELRQSDCTVPLSCSVRLWSLVDRTPDEGFPATTLESVIFPPGRCHRMEKAIPGHEAGFTVFGGIYAECYAPAFPASIERQTGFLSSKGGCFSLPDADIFEIPELVGVMVASRRKYERGESTFRD